jgi:hypothetical protein
VKANQEKKRLTLGSFIHSACRACGTGRARGIIQLAAKARLIVFEASAPLNDFIRER